MKKHFNIHVYGRVQGVFFRSSVRQKAEKLNLSGFVRNESDGHVYIEVEGEKENLEKFVAWCKRGPLFAKVESVKVEEGPEKNFSQFLIEY